MIRLDRLAPTRGGCGVFDYRVARRGTFTPVARLLVSVPVAIFVGRVPQGSAIGPYDQRSDPGVASAGVGARHGLWVRVRGKGGLVGVQHRLSGA